MTKRLFVALEAPTACRSLVRGARDHLAEAFPTLGVRWQPVENLHLTLAFLGNVEEDLWDDCRARLERCAARARPFALATTHLGAFPSAMRPSVLWLGIEAEPDGALAALHRDVAQAYRHLREDGRPFRPHITLGRVKDTRGVDRASLAGALADLPERSEAWTCRAATLFQSTLTPRGAVHTALHTAALDA